MAFNDTSRENDFSRISNCHLFAAHWILFKSCQWTSEEKAVWCIAVNWCNSDWIVMVVNKTSLSIAEFIIKLKFTINARVQKTRIPRNSRQEFIGKTSRKVKIDRNKLSIIKTVRRKRSFSIPPTTICWYPRAAKKRVNLHTTVGPDHAEKWVHWYLRAVRLTRGKNQSRHKLEILNARRAAIFIHDL